MNDEPTFEPLGSVEEERDHMAHALYTVALHLRQGATQLALDRIRGAALRCPSLLNGYPGLLDSLASCGPVLCGGCGVDLTCAEHAPDCPTARGM